MCVFWAAYDDHTTAPWVVSYFQKFFALNLWSNMNAKQPLDFRKQSRLTVIRELASRPLLVS